MYFYRFPQGIFMAYLFRIIFLSICFISLSIISLHSIQNVLKDNELHFVSCKLKAQLGNQLFEIATTLAYAWDYNALPYFPDLNNTFTIYKNTYNRDHIFFRLNATKPPGPYLNILRENKEFFYEPIAFEEDLLLDGFFQSWRYFHHHRDRLLEVFAPSLKIIDDLEKKYADLLKLPNSVALHVRTYQKLIHEINFFPFLGFEYYDQAIKIFPEDYTFVIFSDRPKWCREKFSKRYNDRNLIFIEGNTNIHDLFLMSMMKNFVIANSTFSWWGCYLCQNPNKIVVAPTFWKSIPKNDKIFEPETDDLYFEDWITVTPKYEPYPKDMKHYDKKSLSIDNQL